MYKNDQLTQFASDPNLKNVSIEQMVTVAAHDEPDNPVESVPFVLDPSSIVTLPPEGRRTAIQKAAAALTATKERDAFFENLIALPAGQGISASTTWKQLVIDATVILFPDAVAGAVEAITKAAKKHGFTGFVRKSLTDTIDAAVKQRNVMPNPALLAFPTSVISVWADAPVTTDAKIPVGWIATRSGVQKEGSPHSIPPLVITAVSRDTNSTNCSVLIAAKAVDGWKERTVLRSMLADYKHVTKLADLCCGINSVNCRDVVVYLSAYEIENQSTLGCATTTSQIGWCGNNYQTYVLPTGPVPGSQMTVACRNPTGESEDFEGIEPWRWRP